MWCSAADSHLKLLDRVVRSADFLVGGVLECNLAHRRSVAELYMLFKIKSNPIHPLSGALPLPYVPARVTRGALVAHMHSFASPRCRTSQYHRTFVPLSVSLWNDLSGPVFDGVGLAGFKSRANAFLWARSALSLLSPTILSSSSSSFHGLVVWGWGLWTNRVFSLSPGLAQRTPNNNNKINVLCNDTYRPEGWYLSFRRTVPIVQKDGTYRPEGLYLSSSVSQRAYGYSASPEGCVGKP